MCAHRIRAPTWHPNGYKTTVTHFLSTTATAPPVPSTPFIDVPCRASGRFVTVSLEGPSRVLSLCEVQVWGFAGRLKIPNPTVASTVFKVHLSVSLQDSLTLCLSVSLSLCLCLSLSPMPPAPSPLFPVPQSLIPNSQPFNPNLYRRERVSGRLFARTGRLSANPPTVVPTTLLRPRFCTT